MNALPLAARKAQVAAVVRMELRKNFLTRRGLWIYFLAFAPAAVIWLHSIHQILERSGRSHAISTDTGILAGIFQYFVLKLALFWGCMGIFTYLFRGEVVEKSLHYYFLAPIRRELLVLGKYLAGAITASFFFGAGVLLSFVGMYFHFSGEQIERFLQSGGYQHAFAYLGVTVLACFGYGAFFLLLGIRYKNPVIPSAVLLAWESLSIFLPAWLRKFALFYYLKSLCPVPPPMKGPALLFSFEPVAPWIAVISLIGLTAALLYLASRQLQKTEISYATD